MRLREPDGIKDHLGVTLTPSSHEELGWQQEAGPTAFSRFPGATDYFGDSKQMWMVSVRDLDAMAAQLPAAGIGVEVGQHHYRNGGSARWRDPDGNPVELWQPAGCDALR